MCVSISGRTLSELGLEAPDRDTGMFLNSDILRERSYNAEELASFIEANKPLLVGDQEQVHDVVMGMVTRGSGGVLFLDAPGGTGKTFLINLLLAEIRKEDAQLIQH
ncbi:unnamed protein product [Cylicostephanus goldi]|uniref:ATP-dependent DNA helicase n=1 Tax=Cylicostephanus goldi TaxID=71465 RepID=A0A3P7N1B7_CYLGO|nr:unnamed protein product [Cylicostephanus goldi]